MMNKENPTRIIHHGGTESTEKKQKRKKKGFGVFAHRERRNAR
jgi:hypothetical protein